MANKRLFLALPITENIQGYLKELIEDFNPDPHFKWTPRDNRHISVHYLGDTDESQIPTLIQGFTGLAAGIIPFRLRLQELHTIHKGKYPSMIWTVFAQSIPYETLVNEVCRFLNVPPERKPYAHFTLARLKESRHYLNEMPDHEALEPLPLLVQNMELWETEINPSGTVYTLLAAFPFKEVTETEIRE